jgi:glutamine amidotransferase
MIGIIDLDTGNIASLTSAMQKLNISYKICKNIDDFDNVKKIILPGVGAYKNFMEKLKNKNLDKLIKKKITNKTSILGVCVGFQVLFSSSSEHGFVEGLNIFKGEFKNFTSIDENILVPHVGWNQCTYLKENKLFDGIENNSDFYFTHSYFTSLVKNKIVIAETNYKINFAAAVGYENVYGVQFHPEKSQSNGLQILKNFYERC